MAHSKIGASSMYRWSACPGSVRLCEGRESPSSPYAEEGTRAHELAADILNGKVVRVDDLEMMTHVQTYVEEVDRVFDEIDGGQRLIEHRFSLDEIHPDLFGTADCVIFDRGRKKLHVFDLKYGAGIPVEVIEGGKPNQQLLYYATGAVMSLPQYEVDTVELCIVQPRCFHEEGPIRRIEFSALDLTEFYFDLKDAVKKTEDENAPLNPGEHCRFCPAAPTCPALHSKSIELAKQTFSPQAYDPQQLSETLNQLPTIEAWIKSVRELAYREAEAGRTIPGWKLVEKRAMRRWKEDEETTAEALECVLPDKECFWDRKLKSPAQVEKLLGKGGKKALEDIVISQSSGLTLAPEWDKRPPVTKDAIELFKNQPLIED